MDDEEVVLKSANKQKGRSEKGSNILNAIQQLLSSNSFMFLFPVLLFDPVESTNLALLSFFWF